MSGGLESGTKAKIDFEDPGFYTLGNLETLSYETLRKLCNNIPGSIKGIERARVRKLVLSVYEATVKRRDGVEPGFGSGRVLHSNEAGPPSTKKYTLRTERLRIDPNQ